MADRQWFTSNEISSLIHVVSGLDPERYPHPATKALIYKAKASIEPDRPGDVLIRWGFARK